MTRITNEPVWFYRTLESGYARKCEFYAYDLQTEFKECEAVYIFTKRVPTKTSRLCYKRLYVGGTNNLATAIQDHANSPCLKKHGADSICVHFDKDKASRGQKVSGIISHRDRPPCNKVNTKP